MSASFSFHIHYRQMPPSERRWQTARCIAALEEAGEGCVTEVRADMSHDELVELLASDALAWVPVQDKSLLEGFSVGQFSAEVEEPMPICLSAAGVARLAASGGFFRGAAVTEHWWKSKRRLLACCVISLPSALAGQGVPPGMGALPDVRVFEHQGRWFCLVGNNARPEGLLTCLRTLLEPLAEAAAPHPQLEERTCQMDYFTADAWAEMTLLHEALQSLADAHFGVVLYLHQALRVAEADELGDCFNYLLANRFLQSFINAEAETWGCVVTLRKPPCRRGAAAGTAT